MHALILNVLKFAGFLAVCPIVLAVNQAMNQEMVSLRLFHHKAFLVGISAYVFSYLFIYSFKEVFSYGRSLVAQVCKLFGSYFEWIAYVVPIYTILLLVFYYIFSSMGKMSVVYGVATSFGIAFTFAMHIIMSARELYDYDGVPFKPSYALSIVLVYIANVALLALLFDIVFNSFSFVDFLSSSIKHAERLYRLVLTQLF